MSEWREISQFYLSIIQSKVNITEFKWILEPSINKEIIDKKYFFFNLNFNLLVSDLKFNFFSYPCIKRKILNSEEAKTYF